MDGERRSPGDIPMRAASGQEFNLFQSPDHAITSGSHFLYKVFKGATRRDSCRRSSGPFTEDNMNSQKLDGKADSVPHLPIPAEYPCRPGFSKRGGQDSNLPG